MQECWVASPWWRLCWRVLLLFIRWRRGAPALMRNAPQPSRVYQHDHNSINYNILPNNVWRGLNNPDVPSLSCLFLVSPSLSLALRCAMFVWPDFRGWSAPFWESVLCVLADGGTFRRKTSANRLHWRFLWCVFFSSLFLFFGLRKFV